MILNCLVLEHDTALAKLQDLKGPISIPSCIKPNQMAILVWDTNDFREETASGKGTTHNTNDIIVQRIVPDHDESTDLDSAFRLPHDRKRSFQSPSSNLAIFRGQKKAPPQKMDENLMEDDNRKLHAGLTCIYADKDTWRQGGRACLANLDRIQH